MLIDAAKAAMLALVFAAIASCASAETLDFKFSKDPKAARAWESLSGRWVVKGGAYRDASTYASILTAAALRDKTFRNLSIQFSGDLVPPTTQLSTIIRANLKTSGTVNGYMSIVTYYPDSLMNFEIYRLRNFRLSDSSGTAELLCQQSLTAPQTKLAGVKAEGDTPTATYDGQPICAIQDTTYEKGRVVLVANMNFPRPGFKRVKIVSP